MSKWCIWNFEDPIGLYCLPDTAADTTVKVVKDILIRCDLPLSLCRGEAYDGAGNMSGTRKGVSIRIQKETPVALPVHCFAHSLKLCLQDVGRQTVMVRDALDIVKDIVQLIKFSPKRSNPRKWCNLKILEWTLSHFALLGGQLGMEQLKLF